MSSIISSQDWDTQRVTSVDAQLTSLESYINADVYQALCFKPNHVAIVGISNLHYFPTPELKENCESDSSSALGIALIQPVTAGLEFNQLTRQLFPTKRSIFVNIESVSTMLSFEDLNLIETVLTRLSLARSPSKKREKELNGHDDLATASSDEKRVEYDDPTAAIPTAPRQPYYEVTFHSQRLGLGLKVKGDQIIVNSIQTTEHIDSISIGDRLMKIGDFECLSCTLDTVVQRLSTSTRPITLTFLPQIEHSLFPKQRPQADFFPPIRTTEDKVRSTTEFLVLSYIIKIKKGIPVGLEFERSSCGQFPVVTKVFPAFTCATMASNVDNIDSKGTFELQKPRVPRPGAVVVAVNGATIEELGVDAVWDELTKLLDYASETTDLDQLHSLCFREIDSSLWGNVDSLDLSSSGFALSFIDDLNGRDMPLFRGKLEALELHLERGLGGRAQIIEVQGSSILSLQPTTMTEKGPTLTLSDDEIDDLRTENVWTVSGVATCSLDYFHPRIAFWEPLVEPSQVFSLLERQSGRLASKRPGQVAVELSDRLLRDQSVRAKHLPQYRGGSQMVIVNLTDAALEVTVRAINRLREWRKSVQNNLVDDDTDGNTQADGETETQESEPILEGDALARATSLREQESSFVRSQDARRGVKQAAKQRAAQAALVFAEKRGANNNKKVETAKPFVLRNRTGVSIAFVQENAVLRLQNSSNERRNDGKDLSSVGEYSGISDYHPSSIQELGDKEDARFSMEILTDNQVGVENQANGSTHATGNKIRNYEGFFPSLTIAIQALSGVSIEPLVGLQVYKVGSFVHHLTVRKDLDPKGREKQNDIEYFIPVIWNVEIEDNRRVLTLSTAVRIATTAFATQIEVGVQRISVLDSVESTLDNVSQLGIVRPECPFYLPLWLALKLEAVSVFVRPHEDGAPRYGWGRSSILRFAPCLSIIRDVRDIEKSGIGTWVWEETFEKLDYIRCEANENGVSPIWLAVFSGSTTSRADRLPGSMNAKSVSSMKIDQDHHELISVTLDSNVTLRNMLPMSIDWQLAYLQYGSGSPSIVDGSVPVRSISSSQTDEDSFRQKICLQSGECTEVFACDFESSELQARFKEPNGQNWSSWAPLALQNTIDYDEQDSDDDVNVNALFPRARQVNVQVTNDSFGVPLTFGVRVVPKMTLGALDEPSKIHIYGIEIIVYAELWIRNITTLPLNFGCPSYQVHGVGDSSTSIADDTASRFNAESALMEIASLLEVGDKGTGLNKKAARDLAITGSIESLPNQVCDELWEEVFEYLEIEYSTVKRRWWASESYDSFRMNITQSHENGIWSWIGEQWNIDTAGDVDSALGGWESSRNLLAGVGSFAGSRTFDPSHSIRRRRYFRNRTGHRAAVDRYEPRCPNDDSKSTPQGLQGGLQAFHHPLNDSFSREQHRLTRQRNLNNKAKSSGKAGLDSDRGTEAGMKIAVKCADGKWSLPATIPDTGTNYGILRALASRWPALTTSQKRNDGSDQQTAVKHKRGQSDLTSSFKYEQANLSARLHELCYTVSDVDGEWGEFSRLMVVSPRFMMRNDSSRFTIEVKQAGTPNSSSLKLCPGAIEAFYWDDFRLPGLVCVSPCVTNEDGRSIYRWSGGFDICNLGMVPLRLRREVKLEDCPNAPAVRTIRALVEIRPGTGGFGILISFREEDPSGIGSLFRVENLSPFPVWLNQDGILANPSKLGQPANISSSLSKENIEAMKGYQEDYEANGDLVMPAEKISFALDVPYRQGKYAHRKEASMKELLRVRIALAPLSHRAGIETVKVIGLLNVGESVRLNPSKLFEVLDDEVRAGLQPVRVLAVVCSDGPTRVLKFVLARVSDQDVIGNAIREVSYMASRRAPESASPTARYEMLIVEIKKSARNAMNLLQAGDVTSEEAAISGAMFATLEKQITATTQPIPKLVEGSEMDYVCSIRAEFSGFLFSVVDSTPSEIAVATLRNLNVLARWNGLRTTEASLMMSVGWLQVDNHIPSSPFKVAVMPDTIRHEDGGEARAESVTEPEADVIDTRPLLMVAVAFSPKHSSGIICLRSVTIAPRNLVIAVDLSFLVRLQRYIMGLKDHLRGTTFDDEIALGSQVSQMFLAEQKRNIPFPRFNTAEAELKRAASSGSEHQKFYFQGLTILPAAITLFVAPARALTPAQASLEGKEVAAIHQAVRKGDVLVGSSKALLGVRVGRKNTTPLSVVRGVFKSMVVDALLRLDGASLNFAGVTLRNHISTGPQLSTYLLTHYLASLRQNVPALLGSLAAFGNPLGLIRGLGDGVSDFVNQPVLGLKKSMKELDPMYLVDGVARGTESLARHAVGGFADSASLLTETFSKNMAVLTLDRRYAQKRDRSKQLRLNAGTTVTFAGGVESGFLKLVQGFMDGVTGVVKAPIRGAEKKGIEGFAKGVGKGLLGLLVKPIIGISDAATDVMIGVKNSVEHNGAGQQQYLTLERNQFRPRRPFYGQDKVLRPYKLEDAAAATLMLRTKCAGDNYLSHLDLGDRVALLSVRRFVLLGNKGQELLSLKYKHVSRAEVRQIPLDDNTIGWAIIIVLNTPRKNGSEVEVLSCKTQQEAIDLCSQLQRGIDLVASET